MANLFEAVKQGDLDRTRILIESYVATNADISEKDYSSWTALHYASYYGHLEITKLLIEANANILDRSKGGFTAIDFAKTKEIKEFLKEQLEIQQNGGYLLK